MAKVYPQLSTNQRQYLAEALAGKRQVNVLQSLLTNWESVEEAVENATYATGSAAREQQAFLDSIEGKINQLQSAWSELANSTISSDMIKGVVDLGTNLLTLINTLGGANVAAGVLAMAIGSKGGLIPLFASLGQDIVLNTNLLNGFITTLKGAELAAKLFGAAIQGLAIFALVAVVNTAISAFNKWKNQLNEQREVVNELRSDIDSLQKEYDDLINTNNRSLEDNQRLLELKEELALRKEIAKVEQQRLYEKQFTRKTSVGENYLRVENEEGEKTNITELINRFKSYQELIARTKQEMKETTDASELKAYENKLDDFQATLMETAQKMSEVNAAFNDAKKDGFDFNSIFDGAESEVANFQEFYNTSVLDMIRQTKSYQEVMEDTVNPIMQVSEIMQSLSDSTDLVSTAYKEMSDNGNLSLDTVMQIIEAGGELLDVLEIQDGQYKINTASLEKLFETDKQTAIERIKLSIEQTKAIIAEKEAQLDSMIIVNESQLETVKAANEVAKANLEVANSLAKSLGLQSTVVGQFTQKALDEAKAKIYGTIETQKAAQAELADYRQSLKGLETYLGVLTNESLPTFSGAIDKSASSTSKLKDQTDKLNESLKKQEQILDDLVEKYDNTKQAIVDMIDAEIEALEKANDALGSFDSDNSLANKYNLFKDYILKGLNEEINAIQATNDAEVQYWQDKIDALEAEEKANERNKQLEEARLKLSEAQAQLDKVEQARNQLQKNTRVYKEGVTNSYKQVIRIITWKIIACSLCSQRA